MLHYNIATSGELTPRVVGCVWMKWFRSKIWHGARLALFAMLVQFALTFGLSHWFAQAAPLAQSQLSDSAKNIASTAHAAAAKQSPASPHREHPGDANCA